jgi:hypothetical protein
MFPPAPSEKDFYQCFCVPVQLYNPQNVPTFHDTLSIFMSMEAKHLSKMIPIIEDIYRFVAFENCIFRPHVMRKYLSTLLNLCPVLFQPQNAPTFNDTLSIFTSWRPNISFDGLLGTTSIRRSTISTSVHLPTNRCIRWDSSFPF